MGEVIVFTKVPERGYVKKGLQKKLPAYMVEELYTAFLTDTLAKLSEFEPYIAYYPERKQQMLWTIIGERKYIVQKGKDMWERVCKIFQDFYRLGHEYVAAVNCDVPLLGREHVYSAFSMMQECDIVFGPAHDGGFYLIGGRKVTAEIFNGVEWKSKDTLKRMIENASKLGLKVGKTEPLRDVDTLEDLKAVWEDRNLDKNSKTYEILNKTYSLMGRV